MVSLLCSFSIVALFLTHTFIHTYVCTCTHKYIFIWFVCVHASAISLSFSASYKVLITYIFFVVFFSALKCNNSAHDYVTHSHSQCMRSDRRTLVCVSERLCVCVFALLCFVAACTPASFICYFRSIVVVDTDVMLCTFLLTVTSPALLAPLLRTELCTNIRMSVGMYICLTHSRIQIHMHICMHIHMYILSYVDRKSGQNSATK